jgi:hypothetical protein
VAGQPPRTVIQDSATAQFTRHTPFDGSNWGAVGGFGNPGCVVTAWRVQNPFTVPLLKNLDAGPSVTLTLPDGSTRTLARMQPQSGNYAFSVNDAAPGAQLLIPPAGGAFRFQAPGGADVGPVDAAIQWGPALIWNEQTTISTVSRSQSLTVNWQGGPPNSFVLIQGFSVTADQQVATSFGCTEHVEAGRYTVPRDVLASMVPSATVGGIPSGQLVVANYSFPGRFSATGLNHSAISAFNWHTTVVSIQ